MSAFGTPQSSWALKKLKSAGASMRNGSVTLPAGSWEKKLLNDLDCDAPASAELVGCSVRDCMVQVPKTLPSTATLAEVRSMFEDDHVHMVLLVDGVQLAGTLERGDLPDCDGDAIDHAVMVARTIDPDMPALDALRLLDGQGRRRLAVIETDGTLVGLLCRKRRRPGFCSDADVAARAAERAAGGPR